MKRPLQPKEVALILLPVLGLGCFAWYQHRVDQVSARGMFISNFKVEPETKGYYQSLGYTHRISFTVDHPWPRPHWWGTQSDSKGISTVSGNPLQANGDKLPTYSGRSINPENTVLFGGAVTSSTDGKNLRVWSRSGASQTFQDGHYIFTFKANLAEIPPQAGEVTYHALCRIAGRQSLRIKKVIRPAGQKTQRPLDKDTGNVSLALSTKPFMTFSNNPDSMCYVNFMISHPPTAGSSGVSVHDYDYSITDGKGNRIKIDNAQGPSIHYGMGQLSRVSSTQTKYYIALVVTPSCTVPEPLTLSGKMSVDEHWPIPFSVRLPKR